MQRLKESLDEAQAISALAPAHYRPVIEHWTARRTSIAAPRLTISVDCVSSGARHAFDITPPARIRKQRLQTRKYRSNINKQACRRMRLEGGPMHTVRDMLGIKDPAIRSVAPDDTVLHALGVMAEFDIGGVVVLDNGRLVGILTERDYARRVVLLGRASRDLPVSDIMTSHVCCISPDRTIDECMALMTEKRIRHLPVLDHKEVIGIISIGDVVKATIAEREFEIAQLQSYISG